MALRLGVLMHPTWGAADEDPRVLIASSTHLRSSPNSAYAERKAVLALESRLQAGDMPQWNCHLSQPPREPSENENATLTRCASVVFNKLQQ